MAKKFTLRHLILAIIAIIVLVIVMYTSLVLRDYDIKTDGGIHLVSKTPVPGAPGFSMDNSVPEKLTIRINENGAVSYDIQISRFESMAFAKTYRTALPYKERGLMKGGKKYYVRVRSVATKPNTSRKVVGQWGTVRSTTIKSVKK